MHKQIGYTSKNKTGYDKRSGIGDEKRRNGITCGRIPRKLPRTYGQFRNEHRQQIQYDNIDKPGQQTECHEVYRDK